MAFKFNPITGQLDLVNASGGGGGGTLTGVIPTNSINFSVVGTDVTGDVNLSAHAADINNTAVVLDIESDGIRAEIPNASIQSAALNLQGPVTLTDNSSGTVFSYVAASNKFTFIDYSILRNTNVSCGRLLLVTDSVSVSIASNGDVELSPIGVAFGATVSGSNVNLTYVTTSNGFNGSFKYSLKQWS